MGRRGLVIAPGVAPRWRAWSSKPLSSNSEEVERCVIASFRVAESMGFKGEFREWVFCGSKNDHGKLSYRV
jgi:hypothetical protein